MPPGSWYHLWLNAAVQLLILGSEIGISQHELQFGFWPTTVTQELLALMAAGTQLSIKLLLYRVCKMFIVSILQLKLSVQFGLFL